jgi:hypothetical protein
MVVRVKIELSTFRFQPLAPALVGVVKEPPRAIRVRHQGFTAIDFGSFALSPCAARSESAEAISAPILPRLVHQALADIEDNCTDHERHPMT